jgi:hypothetical protein
MSDLRHTIEQDPTTGLYVHRSGYQCPLAPFNSYFDEKTQEYVHTADHPCDEDEAFGGVFADTERVGNRREMHTEIEGFGKLARLQRTQQLKATDRYIEGLERVFYELNKLPTSELDTIVSKLTSCPFPMFKNPYTFYFACLVQFYKTSMKDVLEYVKQANQPIREVDIVRYIRLVSNK